MEISSGKHVKTGFSLPACVDFIYIHFLYIFHFEIGQYVFRIIVYFEGN